MGCCSGFHRTPTATIFPLASTVIERIVIDSVSGEASLVAENVQRPLNFRDCRCFASCKERTDFSYSELLADGYYSQGSQENWAAERLLGDRTGGTLVSIGAYDGAAFGKTHLLEKQGGAGIAVEPLRTACIEWARNQSCMAVNSRAAQESGTADSGQRAETPVC
jgi:hypothetical protein